MTSSITAIGYPRATPSATPLAAAARSGSQGSPTATGSEATPALVQFTLSAAATSPGAASSGQSPDTQALSTMVQVTESSRDARARADELRAFMAVNAMTPRTKRRPAAANRDA